MKRTNMIMIALAALIGAAVLTGCPDDASMTKAAYAFTDVNGDGVCDTCGQGADNDGDGVCDNYADADGDGICDNRRSHAGMGLQSGGYQFRDGNGNGSCDTCGGNDADGDGVCDNFEDGDGDGVCDNRQAHQQYGLESRGYRYQDGDGDGACDQCGGNDADADGVCDSFVDADGDGVCDRRNSHEQYGQGNGYRGGRA